MGKPELKKYIFTIINLFIFIATAVVVPITLIFGSRSTRLDSDSIPYWQHIVTFTILSNIFLGIVALVSAILSATKKDKFPSNKQLTWYLAATSAGLVTFFTVILFLAPMRALKGKNYFDMIVETMFFLHFLNPILAAISFIFFTGRSKVTLKSRLLATLPVVLYAIPYVLNVVFLKTWPDFYGLTFGGRYYLMPLVFAVFIFLVFGIASLLVFLRHKISSIKPQNMLE